LRFIWVMGPSAAGKKTFIRGLESDQKLRARFEIPDGFVARGPGFQGQIHAVTLAVDLARLSAPAVVIKWQAAGDDELERLRDLRPDAEHHMFFLRRPVEHVHRDLRQRSPESVEQLEGMRAFANNTLSKCCNRETQGFRLTVIDSADHKYVIGLRSE
jgi:hypothetical protein